MKNITATIISVPSRSEFANRLFAEVVNRLGKVALLTSNKKISREAQMENAKAAIGYAVTSGTDWHLFLEDDQIIYPVFWEALPRLIDLAVERGIDVFYLSNRQVSYERQEHHSGFIMNRLGMAVKGAHGLLYRTKYAEGWLLGMNTVTTMDLDMSFWWSVGMPVKAVVYQVVAPILMQHVGAISTLNVDLAG